MGDTPLFSTTTTRTSHVGQPGYDNEEVWLRFIKRYEPKLKSLAQRRYPKCHDMIDDVIQILYGKIITNPLLLSYDPTETHFRTVLVKHFFNLLVDAVRTLKTQSKEHYIENVSPLIKTEELPEYEKRRIRLLTIDMVARNFADLNHDMGNLGPEPKYLDRVVWKSYYVHQVKPLAYAIKSKQNYKQVLAAFKRANDRVIKDAEAVLASMGLC